MKRLLILSLVCLISSCRLWVKEPQLSDVRDEYNKEDYIACLEKFDKYISRNSLDKDSLYEAKKIKAKCLYNLALYKQCSETINEIIDHFLYDSQLYEMRGDCYQHLDKNQLALRDYTILIHRFDSSSGFNKRGLLYIALGDFELANNDFDSALKLDSTNFSALNNKGLFFSYKEDYQNALKFYKKAILLGSNKITYFNVGEIYEKIGTTDSACFYYKIAADLGYTPAKKALLEKCQY